MAQTIFVRTNDRPFDYLTAGKIYECQGFNGETGHIISDVGSSLFILMKGCAHLRGGDWEIVESPISDKRDGESCAREEDHGPQMRDFTAALTALSAEHGIGITGAPVLFVMEPEDYAYAYQINDASELGRE